MEERNQQLYGNENAGSSFFAMMSRMKYINRCTYAEFLSGEYQ